MQRVWRVMGLLVFLLILSITAVRAGVQLSDFEDVRQQIDAVTERMQQVRSLVEQSSNDRASNLLEQGIQYLEDAVTALEDREDERQARNFVRRALELINSAAQEVSRNRGISQDQVERELIRLRELIRSTEEHIQRVQLASAHDLFDRARTEAEKAQQAFEEGAYLQAMELIRRATELCQQASKLTSNTPIDGTIDFEAILNELVELKAEVTGYLNNTTGQSLRDSFSNASQLMAQAERNFERGQISLALNQARHAREIFQWILRATGKPNENFDPQERAQRELARAQNYLVLFEMPFAVSDPVIESWVEQVETWIDQAEIELNSDPVAGANTALNLLQNAIQLSVKIQYQMHQAGSHNSSLPEPSTAANEEYLKLVEETIPKAIEQVRKSPTEKAVQSLEKAQEAAERAEKNLDREQYEQALQEINTARTFARQAISQTQQ